LFYGSWWRIGAVQVHNKEGVEMGQGKSGVVFPKGVYYFKQNRFGEG